MYYLMVVPSACSLSNVTLLEVRLTLSHAGTPFYKQLCKVTRIPLKVKREVDEWDVEETQYVPILQEGLRRIEKVRINVTARVRYICAEQVGASPF